MIIIIMDHVGDGDTKWNWSTRYVHQRIDSRAGRLGRLGTI